MNSVSHLNYYEFILSTVPKKVLKDRFDTPPEQDEPQQKDMEHDHDELYDDDQFFKEPEAIPPEPKLQGDLAKERSPDLIPAIVSHQASSPRPPMRNRDESTLEGKCFISRYVMETRKFLLKVTENNLPTALSPIGSIMLSK